MLSLAEQIANNQEGREILADSNLNNHEKVEELKGIGIETTESSIRRYLGRPTTQRQKVDSAPKGWEPFAEEAGKIGKALVRLPRPGATEHDLLIGAGFDPDCWRIKGSVNTRRWMRYDQEWLYYYKFDVEQGESLESKDAHVADLVKVIRRKPKPAVRFADLAHDRTYVHVMADWQIGKREGNAGTEQTVARYREALAQSVQRIKDLRKIGVVIDRLALIMLGDLVEGCDDHYAMQTFSVDLDRRSQNRVVRELITSTILTLAPMFVEIDIALVGGNHGENRKDGQAHTTFADNDDVGCPEAVKEAFDLAGWDHLNWHIPQHELTMCVDLGGVKVGMAHGHQFKGGVNALKKAEDWWRSHVFGEEAVNQAQILLSGHFHHFANVNVAGKRSWIQSPTIDPGSQWYTNISGITAIPGVLTLVVSHDTPLGYDHLRVLHPSDSGSVAS